MTKEKPEALQLASTLDSLGLSLILRKTSEELRRLHEENEILRECLRRMYESFKDQRSINDD
jgi:hypothetical protein